ncbi:MAG: addiction module toxin, HicA family [Acaryochloridaceae cyanobacterium RU_4_10]|nr:addiction module toxin, HicA family [Acaryochloridaceae cyanobacterium RU_4_10]
MPKLPRTTGRKAIRALEQMGFVQVRQRGSHITLKRETDEGVTGCTVPAHDEIAIGTLRSILRQAQVTPEEFMENL